MAAPRLRGSASNETRLVTAGVNIPSPTPKTVSAIHSVVGLGASASSNKPVPKPVTAKHRGLSLAKACDHRSDERELPGCGHARQPEKLPRHISHVVGEHVARPEQIDGLHDRSANADQQSGTDQPQQHGLSQQAASRCHHRCRGNGITHDWSRGGCYYCRTSERLALVFRQTLLEHQPGTQRRNATGAGSHEAGHQQTCCAVRKLAELAADPRPDRKAQAEGRTHDAEPLGPIAHVRDIRGVGECRRNVAGHDAAESPRRDH